MSTLNYINYTHVETREFKSIAETILGKIAYLKYDSSADAEQMDKQIKTGQ
jgi:hypothetical protein